MQGLFVVNLLLALLWAVLTTSSRVDDLIVGFLIGFAVVSLYERDYGRRGARLFSFVLYVLWKVFQSSITLAWYLIQPKLNFEPGIVAVPLDVQSPIEITTLASTITLTPGTLTIDLGVDKDGRKVLFVHSLFSSDPDAVRRGIKRDFERRIITIFHGEE